MNTDKLLVYLKIHELDFIMAAAILILGFVIIQYLKSMLLKSLSKKNGDHTIKLFLINLSYIFALVVIGIMVLNKLGVPTTSLLTLLGASSLAIALSLKDSLSNIAAGVLIIFQKRYRIGDKITVDTVTGYVSIINIYSTELTTVDNESICIPNSKIIMDKVINHTRHTTRRMVIPLFVAYTDNLSQIKSSLEELINNNEKVLKSPKSSVSISGFELTGILLNLNIWLKTSDYNNFKTPFLEDVKKLFDDNKFTYIFKIS